MTVLLPDRTALRDMGFLTVLFGLAMLGFATTYTGWTFLVVAGAGLVFGMVVGQLANARRQPMITVLFLTVVVFFLFGGAVALQERAAAGVLPTPGTVLGLADVGVHGWKQLLTTLPPVDGSGPLLVIPYIFGLLCGAGGLTLAGRVSASAAPLFAPTAVLAAVILLGTGEPVGQPWRSIAFGVICLCWTAARGERRRQADDVVGRRTRLAGAGALVAVAGAAAALVGPLLPGVDSADRVVLRDHVDPPFQIGAYPSPLVGFRKYTKDANQLWDQTLFQVHGLPEGERIRIAALDDYDGLVWRAAPNAATGPALNRNSFQRVGTRIPSAAAGAEKEFTVTIEPAYASADDVNAWLPGAGRPVGIEFAGTGAAAHTDGLRFNLATGCGIVTDRLRTGSTYTMRTVLGSVPLPDDPQPFGPSTLDGSVTAIASSKATTWSGKATSLGDRLRAVAAYLRDNGAYSDGGPGEGEFLPGHSTGRLTAFFNAPRPVGDDEQYAAAYALVANQLGMPARVVLGATVAEDGQVRGQDVQAWVEMRLSDGRWATVPGAEFMPDKSKKPDRTPPQEIENTDAAVVPPPNTVQLPDSLLDASQVDSTANRRLPSVPNGHGWWPAWLTAVLVWGGSPTLFVVAVLGSIIAMKALRRRRRRTTGPVVTRLAQGWYEVVDQARDFGATVATGTRMEVARQLPHDRLVELAAAADAAIFGPGTPSEQVVQGYWTRVDETRRAMTRAVGRWRRFRAAVNPRSLRPLPFEEVR